LMLLSMSGRALSSALTFESFKMKHSTVRYVDGSDLRWARRDASAKKRAAMVYDANSY